MLTWLRAGDAAAARLPTAVGRGLAGPFGLGAARMPTPAVLARRAMLRRHLRRVVGPSPSAVRVEAMVDATFVAYARYWAESLRLPHVEDRELDAAWAVEGLDRLDAARDDGRGVILALPHLGGWEWGGRWLTRSGRPISVVVEVLDQRDVFEWFAGLRTGLGMEVIPNDAGAAAACLRALRAGRVLCLLCDRVVGATPGVEVDFFGAPARLPAGVATLALRTGAAVLPAAVYFAPGAGHLGVIGEAVDATRSAARLRDDVEAVTARVAGALEALIGAAPTQWYAFGPIWDDDPAW